jgi:hypothetical protein
MLSVVYFLAAVGVFAFLAFYMIRRVDQRTIFGGEPYRVGWVFFVAVGRAYAPLTHAKIQALRAEGYGVEVSNRSDIYSRVIIPAYGRSDAVIQAGEIGQRHHLMLLWN